MLYNGVFGCHGNTCYLILIGAYFYIVHNIDTTNIYTDFEICDTSDRYFDQEHFKTNQKSL